MGLLSAIFGGGGSRNDVNSQTQNDINVTPTTNLNNNISTVVDFTQAGQLISGSLDGFSSEFGRAGNALGEGVKNLTKTASAIALIALIGTTLK